VTAGDPTPDLRTGLGIDIPAWTWWALAAIAAMAVIPAIKLVRRRRRLARIRTGDVSAAWEEIIDRLRDLGETVEVSQTPLEIADSTHEDFVPLATLYSAVAYGGTPHGDGRRAFETATDRIDRRYQRAHRALSWMAPTSLRKQ
jgi:hypothetical protein